MVESLESNAPVTVPTTGPLNAPGISNRESGESVTLVPGEHDSSWYAVSQVWDATANLLQTQGTSQSGSQEYGFAGSQFSGFVRRTCKALEINVSQVWALTDCK